MIRCGDLSFDILSAFINSLHQHGHIRSLPASCYSRFLWWSPGGPWTEGVAEVHRVNRGRTASRSGRASRCRHCSALQRTNVDGRPSQRRHLSGVPQRRPGVTGFDCLIVQYPTKVVGEWQPVLWWWRLSPLRRRFTFAAPKENSYSFTTPVFCSRLSRPRHYR